MTVIKKKTISHFNLIWMSIFFAVVYWMLEAVRETIVLEGTVLSDHLFKLDTISFWIRMLAVLVLILFGIFAQSQRKQAETVQLETPEPGEGETRIILIGVGFAIVYWLLESVRDFMLFEDESFLKHLLSPNMFVFWMRVLAICVMILFSVYAQNMINTRKKMLNALREANLQLKTLDQMKNDFLSVVSHELRTPIAIIREGVTLCLEKQYGDLNEFQNKMLKETVSNIDRLNRLVTDLLDISRIEAGKMSLHKRLLDINRVARVIYEHYLKQCQKKGVELLMSVPETPVRTFADEDKLLQIFNNLLSNALRYTDKGGTISILIRDTGKYIKCGVKDTGIGIAKENINKLFSKYEQVGHFDAEGYKGTGLGLAICKGLAEKHGGEISVSSELGKGTVFVFTIKKETAPAILIIDDEPSAIEVVKHYLTEDGYHFTEAEDGITGLEKALNEAPALVLLDMILPGMNGYEVLGRLKNDLSTKDIPVILMSASTIDIDRLKETKGANVLPMLQKPLDKQKLRAKVHEALIG